MSRAHELLWSIGIPLGLAGICTVTWLCGWYTLLGWLVWVSTIVAGVAVLLAARRTWQEQKTSGWRRISRISFLAPVIPFVVFISFAFKDWEVYEYGVPVSQLKLSSVVIELQPKFAGVPNALNDALGSLGTAFVTDRRDGKLWLSTNAHCLNLGSVAVVALALQQRQPGSASLDSYELVVTFPTGEQRPVERIAVVTGGKQDAARLEVSAEGLVEGQDFVIVPYSPDFLERLDVQPGDEVIAVGTPLRQAFAGSQSFGRVSTIRQSIPYAEFGGGPWVEHDAMITGGNSGGPLFLKRGNRAFWIGMNTAMIPDSQLNFSLYADAVVSADYVWSRCTPAGIASLVQNEYGVSLAKNPASPVTSIGSTGGRSQPITLFKPINPLNHLVNDMARWSWWKNGGWKILLGVLYFFFLTKRSSGSPNRSNAG